jgi:hypothetical protein
VCASGQFFGTGTSAKCAVAGPPPPPTGSCAVSALPTIQGGSWGQAPGVGYYASGAQATLACNFGLTMQPAKAVVVCSSGQYFGTGTSAKCVVAGPPPPPPGPPADSCAVSALPKIQGGSWGQAPSAGYYAAGVSASLVCQSGLAMTPPKALVVCSGGKYYGTGTTAKCG